MPNPYNIHSPGGQLITNQIVRRVPLQLQGKGFIAHLIVLPTQRVDIILGMNWMKEQGVLLDTNAHSVHIKPSDQGSMTLSLRNPESTTSTVNHTEGKALADIPVVCEYQMFFRRIYPGCHRMAMLNLQLNCNRERHQFPEDLIGCHPMN